MIACATASIANGCNLEPKSHTAQVQKMEDTIFKSFPTVNRASIEVKDDFGTEVNVTLGDVTLYNAPEQERAKVTAQISEITRYVFSAERLKSGKVIFVKEETTTTVAPGTEKTLEMSLPKGQ